MLHAGFFIGILLLFQKGYLWLVLLFLIRLVGPRSISPGLLESVVLDLESLGLGGPGLERLGNRLVVLCIALRLASWS